MADPAKSVHFHVVQPSTVLSNFDFNLRLHQQGRAENPMTTSKRSATDDLEQRHII
jgi:hypothetical protein